jgi:hypothetical protein
MVKRRRKCRLSESDSAFLYFARGTVGPVGFAGATFSTGLSTIDRTGPLPVLPAKIARIRLVEMKHAAMIPVALVNKLPDPRAETSPPMVPPPIPRAPPSLFCNKTTTTKANAKNK